MKAGMRKNGVDGLLVSDNADLYYLTGRVFAGYVYISTDSDEPYYAVKRPCHLENRRMVMIRKPEEMTRMFEGESGIRPPRRLALEMGALSYNAITRLMKIFPGVEFADATPVMAAARAVKTDEEIAKIRFSGVKHRHLYERITHLYQEGMRDIELQVEIERAARLEGCLGQFRVAGGDMELFMGNLLVGENADNPSPYDFAMGGAGMDPSLPVGADGTIIKPGVSVMVDVNGNFTGYMTDMTRCYAVEPLPERAARAHQLSIDICAELARMGRPGVEAKALYNRALEMATEAGFAESFMGHRQHAGFVGHGVGIEINELPVIAPRSRDILAAGNVIALEPKFVIPGVGAVGIENTYRVTDSGPMERLTDAPEEIIYFD
ncbi:MAG: M24 family metallopeptidase [Muribaculaceae bacterium]